MVSELSEEVKDMILERMPTRDAARCAILSTGWRDAWSRHGRLIFDEDFFRSIESSSRAANKDGFAVNLINNILMLQTGSIKQFRLDISCLHPEQTTLQSDLERWCLYLSRNGVEELEFITCYSETKYKLPLCLLSCKTIRQLTLEGFVISFLENLRCVFPGLTSSQFSNVEFRGNVNGLVNTILLKLQNLALYYCDGVCNFVASAPQLESLIAYGDPLDGVTTRLLTLHLISINTLCLSADTFSGKDVVVASAALPIATNLREIMLDHFTFEYATNLTFLINLLKNSPKLCLLRIDVAHTNFFMVAGGWQVVDSTFLAGLAEGGLFVETVKINGFTRSEMELCFLKLTL